VTNAAATSASSQTTSARAIERAVSAPPAPEPAAAGHWRACQPFVLLVDALNGLDRHRRSIARRASRTSISRTSAWRPDTRHRCDLRAQAARRAARVRATIARRCRTRWSRTISAARRGCRSGVGREFGLDDHRRFRQRIERDAAGAVGRGSSSARCRRRRPVSRCGFQVFANEAVGRFERQPPGGHDGGGRAPRLSRFSTNVASPERLASRADGSADRGRAPALLPARALPASTSVCGGGRSSARGARLFIRRGPAQARRPRSDIVSPESRRS